MLHLALALLATTSFSGTERVSLTIFSCTRTSAAPVVKVTEPLKTAATNVRQHWGKHENGAFTGYFDIRPGTYVLDVATEKCFSALPIQVTVSAGVPRDIAIALVPRTISVGMPYYSHGLTVELPATSLTAVLWSIGSSAPPRRPNVQGRVRYFENLRPGKYKLGIFAGPFALSCSTVTISSAARSLQKMRYTLDDLEQDFSAHGARTTCNY